jgi:hypothetical protein
LKRDSEPIKIRDERIHSEQLSKKDFYGPPKQQKPKYSNNNSKPPTNSNSSSNINSTQIVRSMPNSTPLWSNAPSHPTRNSNQLVRYNITPQNRLVLNRRNEIVKHLKLVAMGVKQRNNKTTKSIPYTISIHDPLFHYLPYCLSFITPPDPTNMQDSSGYYKREFIYGTIIPNLQREAAVLSVSKGMGSTQSILDVQGAINHHLDEHPVFKCRLCPDCNPSVIRKMKIHLRDVHALFNEKDLSKLYVDPDAVINFLHFAFVPEINYLR